MILNKLKEKYSKQCKGIGTDFILIIGLGLFLGLCVWRWYPNTESLTTIAAVTIIGFMTFYFLDLGCIKGLIAAFVATGIIGLAAGLVIGTYPLIPFILIFLVITEILFWLDSKKIKPKQNKYIFTLERKAEAGIEAALMLGAYPYLKYLYENYNNIFQVTSQFICQYGIYPLMFSGVVGLIGIWIWINSLKYKKAK